MSHNRVVGISVLSFLLLFVMLPIGLMTCAVLSSYTTPETIGASAESNAATYADKLGLSVTGVACSTSDSDRDGYVSCTLMQTDGSRTPIECGYNVVLAPLGQQTGCKSVVIANGFPAQPAVQ